MKPQLPNIELEKHLKKAMGHQSPAPRCRNCRHFVGCDCSGDTHALPSHCTLSPATIVYTHEDDVCKHFEHV